MAARKFSATWRSGAVKILLVAEIRHDLNPWRKFAMAEKIAVAEYRHGGKRSPWRKIAMAEKNRHGGFFFVFGRVQSVHFSSYSKSEMTRTMLWKSISL
jgi:hypothetical protein